MQGQRLRRLGEAKWARVPAGRPAPGRQSWRSITCRESGRLVGSPSPLGRRPARLCARSRMLDPLIGPISAHLPAAAPDPAAVPAARTPVTAVVPSRLLGPPSWQSRRAHCSPRATLFGPSSGCAYLRKGMRCTAVQSEFYTVPWFADDHLTQ